MAANKKRKKRKRGEKKRKKRRKRKGKRGEERREISYCKGWGVIGALFVAQNGNGGPRVKFRPSGGPSVSNLVFLYHTTMMGMRMCRRYQRKASGARSNASSSTGTWIRCVGRA